MSRRIDSNDYERSFGDSENPARREKALEHALEIRKFEIELYWKRATYFWTFIAAALAGYGFIQASKDLPQKEHFSVPISVLGFVFSFAWQAVNRGSKQWQENWENHVALLEDSVIGPLYKTVTKRPPVNGARETLKQVLTGPYDYSVSKVNQIVSLFVMAVWILLILNALPRFSITARIDWFLTLVILLGGLTCLAIRKYARTEQGEHKFIVTTRDCRILPDDASKSEEPNSKERSNRIVPQP